MSYLLTGEDAKDVAMQEMLTLGKYILSTDMQKRITFLYQNQTSLY